MAVPPHPIDESPIGAWIGLAYVMVCLTLWIPIDLWLHRHHHEYITTEVRELLEGGGWPAVGFVVAVGAVIGLGLYHFFYQRNI